MAAWNESQTVTEDVRSAPLSYIMRTDVVTISMDTSIGEAMDLCCSKHIRHLPVVDEEGKVAGLVTDRDLRARVSHRIGTTYEKNADRETLQQHVHVIMIRKLVTGSPKMTLEEAALLMLQRRVGCLLVVHKDRTLAGMVTTSDFLRIIAQCQDRP